MTKYWYVDDGAESFDDAILRGITDSVKLTEKRKSEKSEDPEPAEAVETPAEDESEEDEISDED